MSALHIVPTRHADTRGWFSETWNQKHFEAAGVSAQFCQDNHSLSKSVGTLRGLHFQSPPFAQAKLVRCLRGRVFDVAVDLRRQSPTYKKWIGVELTAERGNQLFIPAGYAHGFLTLEPNSEIAYKVDQYYNPGADGGIAWNDPDIAISWPDLGGEPLLSDKDAALPALAQFAVDFPYDGHPLNAVTD